MNCDCDSSIYYIYICGFQYTNTRNAHTHTHAHKHNYRECEKESESEAESSGVYRDRERKIEKVGFYIRGEISRLNFLIKRHETVTVLSDVVGYSIWYICGMDGIIHVSRSRSRLVIHMLTNCLSVQVLMKFVVPGKPKCYEKR